MSRHVTILALLGALLVTLHPSAMWAQATRQIAFASPRPHFVAASALDRPVEVRKAAALNRRVSLDLVGVPVATAIEELSRQADLQISYSSAALPKGKLVTIRAQDIAVATGLTEMLLAAELDVVVDRGGQLALVPCRHTLMLAEAQDTGAIVGRVTDKATGNPIAGATVVVEGTRKSSTTEGDGRFRIGGLEGGTYTVRARYIGYSPLAATVTVSASGDVEAAFALEKSVQALDELVTVTPGGMQTELRALPSPMTVITGDEIARRNPLALADVVQQEIPGASAAYSAALPRFTNFSVRGGSSIGASSAMKIFIDGIESANYIFDAVDPESISRIEVIRGPQASTVYGPDAAGGVVQIFTKRGDANSNRARTSLRAEAGLVQTPYEGFGSVVRQQYGASVDGGANGVVSYSLGATYTRTPDFVPNGELSRQETGSLFGALRYSGSQFSIDLHGRYLPGEYGIVNNPLLAETGVPFQSKPNLIRQQVHNETYGIRLEASPLGWWRTSLTVGIDRSGNPARQLGARRTTPDDTLLTVFDIQQRKAWLSVNTSLMKDFSRSLGASVAAGIDYANTALRSSFTAQALNTEGDIQTEPPGGISESRLGLENTGYFSQAELRWRDMLYLSAGVRADQNSNFGRDFGTAVSPRVGVALTQALGEATVKLRVAYGRSTRAPLPLQASGGAFPFNITLPNLLLEPERQSGWDGGIDLDLGGNALIGITLYTQRATNLIATVLVGDTPLPTDQYRNVGAISNRGFELEGRVEVTPWLRARAQYAYTRSRITELGEASGGGLRVGDAPPGLPAHTAGGTVDGSLWNGGTVSGGVTFVGSSRNFDVLAFNSCLGATGPCQPAFEDYVVRYPGFAHFNLSVTQQLLEHLDAMIHVDNAFNNLTYDGSLTNGVPQFGRVTTVGARARW
ncbi:MAG: TonB-dependent receptor [Gemmatimonadales bacterium]|nr:TonB-dependent receptor [Gemmatimonadales bacterium]